MALHHDPIILEAAKQQFIYTARDIARITGISIHIVNHTLKRHNIHRADLIRQKISPQWLIHLHHDQRLSLKEIATRLKLSHAMVSKLFSEYNIPIIKRQFLTKAQYSFLEDKDKLKAELHNYTPKEIAKRHGIAYNTIIDWMRKYNIKYDWENSNQKRSWRNKTKDIPIKYSDHIPPQLEDNIELGFLYEEYGYDVDRLAADLDTNPVLVFRYLQKHHIPIRQKQNW